MDDKDFVYYNGVRLTRSLWKRHAKELVEAAKYQDAGGDPIADLAQFWADVYGDDEPHEDYEIDELVTIVRASKPAPLWRVIIGGTLALVYVAAWQLRAWAQAIRRFPLWRWVVTISLVWISLAQMLLTLIAGVVGLVKRGVTWLLDY